MPGEYILTFPGAYHSGFSTGLNIGEAVNFVSKSWLQYGFKCQDIYRKSREKIPVFPTDWLVVENIRNLKNIQIDLETKMKLKEAYDIIYKDEIISRQDIESIIKNSIGVNKNGPSNLNGRNMMNII